MKAIWNDQVIAESDDTVIVEGNHYFPPESVKSEYLTIESTRRRNADGRGLPSYYDLVVDGKTNRGRGLVLSVPEARPRQIEGRIAFWKGVQVTSG